MRYKLEELKKNPELIKKLSDPDENKLCLIWSGEWESWWTPNASGYTKEQCEAGIYRFRDAWNISHHAGPEKQIEYHLLSQLDYEEDTDIIQEIENINKTNLGNTLKSRLLIGKCKTCGAIVAGSHSKDINHHKELAEEWLWENLIVEWGGDTCTVGGCKCQKRENVEARLKELGLQ